MSLFKRPPQKSKEQLRRFPRISHSLKINYQIGGDTLRMDCFTQDISEGGICLHLYQKLETGAALKLYIYFPDATEPFLILGKVVWIKDTPGRDFPFAAGIMFDFLDSTSRSK
jgi:Tfp pilus assembly protein PilZ